MIEELNIKALQMQLDQLRKEHEEVKKAVEKVIEIWGAMSYKLNQIAMYEELEIFGVNKIQAKTIDAILDDVRMSLRTSDVPF